MSPAAPARAALLLLVVLSGACMATSGPMQMPLRWTPTGNKHMDVEAADALRDQTIQVATFVDAREDRAAVGRNSEARINNQEKGDWIVCTTDDVGAFLTEGFKTILAASGIASVSTGATRVVTAEVQTFFVNERDKYHADVIVHFFVMAVGDDATPNGEPLWQGFTEGHVEKWGRSYKRENYQEALSDAYVEAVLALLGNREFQQAFKEPQS